MLKTKSGAVIGTPEPHGYGLRFLRIGQVVEVTGLPKSTIYELIAENRFPKQVLISDRVVGWIESEIREWMLQRIAEARGGDHVGAAR
jgi:prophage regulatory protein